MSTCLHPIKVHGVFFPCGKCPNCTQNKRNALTARFMLESAFCGGPTYFVTLTYDPEHIPRYNGINCFDKTEIQKFIKRIRNELPPFKFFCTSEYGDRSSRSHYHLLLWLQRDEKLPIVQSILESKWKRGFVRVSLANDSRLSYVCKYTLKNDAYLFKDLPNGHPLKPFRLFSSRPGIGSSAIPFVNEYIYNGGKIRSKFVISNKTIIFDTYIKRHIDPSLYEEIKNDTYFKNYAEIQDSLAKSYRSNLKEVKDHSTPIFINGKYFQKDYSKDNEIRNRRKSITQLKKQQL